jgi:nucleoside-triphosphatase
MGFTGRNILITGLPGVGKTTLIKKISEELQSFHPGGFYTEEIEEEGIRKGFELISLNGRNGLLSHIDIKTSYRVGKYRVDIESFDDFLISIPFFDPSTGLIIIDEIGRMECLSEKFKKILKEILDSEKLVIATIALKGSRYIEEIKKRKDTKLFEITETKRNILLAEILREVEMGPD